MYIYQCKHFKIWELVPPNMLTDIVEDMDKLWLLFDMNALKSIDALRERYGPAIINTHHIGGNLQYRGWRPFNCKEGSKFSQHKRGAAFDLTFLNISAKKVRQDIKQMPYNSIHYHGLQHIRRIENNVSWLHIDTGHSDQEGIKFFNP